MQEVLNIALHGMQQDMLRVSHIGMNLANALTPGYQRQVTAIRPYQPSFAALVTEQQALADFTLGTAPTLARVLIDTRPGTLRTTGQALDVAIAGPGYFEIATESGPAYTRQGSFRVDARGRLVTALGHPVIGYGGEIVLETAKPVIDGDGRIKEAGRVVGQIKVVQFERPETLERLGDGLFSAAGSAPIASDSPVRQGAVENANVSTMHEMVQLIETMRHFESMQRVAQGYDELLGGAIRKLGEL